MIVGVVNTIGSVSSVGDGAKYGPELWVDGNVSLAGLPGYAVYDAPTRKFTVKRDATSSGTAALSAVMDIGKDYRIIYDFAPDGGEASHNQDIRTGISNQSFTVAGSRVIDFTALSTFVQLNNIGMGFSWSCANISLREILV